LEILITGANGFLGRYLISALQARGDVVRALVLPGEDTTWLEGNGVVTYQGDIRDPHALGVPMRGVRAVFHLAAMMGLWRPLQDYVDVNVTGTANVCRAALAAGIERLVVVSSTVVYGFSLGRVAVEDSPFAPFRDPYAMTKAEADRVVQRMIGAEKLPAVIVRPDQFFGPGDRVHFAQFADRLLAGKGMIVGSGRNVLPLIYVTDVVQGLLLALDCERAVGNAYNLSSDEVLTQEEYMSAIARAIGGRPPRVRVPYALLYTAAAAFQDAALLMHSKRRPAATRFGIAFLGSSSRHSNEKARRELGFSPRVSLREGVRLTARWYLEQEPPMPKLLSAAAL
jgi:nucleoside-diphosphate-sugar epimerase